MNVRNYAQEIALLVPRLIRGIKSRYLTLKEISSAQIIILSALEDWGPLSLRKLAQIIGVSPPTASVLVDRLVKARQVERRQDIDDRRKIIIKINQKGKKVLNRFRLDIEKRWEKILTQTLNPQEIENYLAILRKIVESLEK